MIDNALSSRVRLALRASLMTRAQPRSHVPDSGHVARVIGVALASCAAQRAAHSTVSVTSVNSVLKTPWPPQSAERSRGDFMIAAERLAVVAMACVIFFSERADAVARLPECGTPAPSRRQAEPDGAGTESC